ncbi:putative Transcription factor domain-containing protein [Seiridium cardinale]
MAPGKSGQVDAFSDNFGQYAGVDNSPSHAASRQDATRPLQRNTNQLLEDSTFNYDTEFYDAMGYLGHQLDPFIDKFGSSLDWLENQTGNAVGILDNELFKSSVNLVAMGSPENWNPESPTHAPPIFETSSTTTNFSLTQSYGIPQKIARAAHGRLGADLTNTLKGFVSAMSTDRTKTAAQTQTQCTSDRSWWHQEGEETVRCFVDACFDVFDSMPMFLEREAVYDTVREARTSRVNALSNSFADAIVALGIYAYNLRRQPRDEADLLQAQVRLQAIPAASRCFQDAPNSLLKLQAAIAEEHTPDAFLEIIMSSISCARDLCRPNHETLDQSTRSRDSPLKRRALQFLYILEVSYAVCDGTLPIIDYNWICHAVPTCELDANGYLSLHFAYAKVLHRIFLQHYGHGEQVESPAAIEGSVRQACQILQEWNGRLPTWLREAHSTNFWESEMDKGRRRDALCIFIQFHKANLLIHGPWVSDLDKNRPKSPDNNVADKLRLLCMKQCLTSSYTTIRVLDRVLSSGENVYGHSTHIRVLITTAVCFLTYYLTCIEEKENDEVAWSHLAICCGLLGKLRLEYKEMSPLRQFWGLLRAME